ncbi:hypothetical protein [Gordonia humi]|uniref:Uncharacterized protein n=1 Tax=Gordonia humi TaxID=686429 RepID=A0A840EUC4_9ACTN|nr:hypothetical protein [Gordonia humi]MBB4135292.1 hypothetical protein [Gordonia humi]
MSTTTRSGRDEWIELVCMHVADRAESTGWMVAVRHGADAVTFGDLAAGINDYRRIVGAQQLSLESALTGALLHAAPGLIGLDPADCARAVDQMISWLGRDIAPVAVSSAPVLRSVG